MTKKIKDAADSIKSKLSFDDYKPSEHNDIKTEEQKHVIKVKKVKRTFYLDERVVEKLDSLYAKKLSEKKPVDKSDVVAYALEKLLEDESVEIPVY